MKIGDKVRWTSDGFVMVGAITDTPMETFPGEWLVRVETMDDKPVQTVVAVNALVHEDKLEAA